MAGTGSGTATRSREASRPRASGGDGVSRAAGFTLAEMLVAMVITGILAGGVVAVLLEQNEFYEKTDALIYAEQSLRGTADLATSELRTASSRDLRVAESDSVETRADQWRAVVCDTDGSAGVLWAYIYSFVNAPNLKGPVGMAAQDPPHDGAFQYYDDYAPTVTAATSDTDTPAQVCEAVGAPDASSTPLERYVEISWGKTMPAQGAVLRRYGRIAYSFSPSSLSSGTAVFRNGQELAAPLENTSLAYLMRDGSVQSSVSLPSGDVDAIRITATALGQGSNRHDMAREVEYHVPLRNTDRSGW